MTGFCCPSLSRKVQPRRIRVARAEFEDIAHFHAACHPQWTAAFRAGVSLIRRGDVGDDIGGVIARVVGVEQVVVGLIGPGHQVGAESDASHR